MNVINSFVDARGVEMVAKPSGSSCDGCDYYALGDDKLCREAPICGGSTRGVATTALKIGGLTYEQVN